MLVWEFNQRISGLDDRQKVQNMQVARIQHAIFTGQVKHPPSIWDLSGVDMPKTETRKRTPDEEKLLTRRAEQATRQRLKKQR